MIERRTGFKEIADFGTGSDLELERRGDKIVVKRDGRIIGYIAKDAVIRIVRDTH